MYHQINLGLALLFFGSSLALPSIPPVNQNTEHQTRGRASYPFSRIVAFGDNLSDNGNGSYAHCVANPNNCNDKIYGYKTWTNGPVAVQYLSDYINVPLTDDYAFGAANGGSKIGATINNSYTQSMYAPDAFDQVGSYLKADGTSKNIDSTLHFLWIGNNDISLKHISVTSKSNPAFANQMADQMQQLVQRLVDNGANYIIVPSIYPKQLAPFRDFIASNPTQIDNLGSAISQANAQIAKQLKNNFGKKVYIYDAFGTMVNIYNKASSYGIDYVLPYFCDPRNWAICQSNPDSMYWMQYTDPTTIVHDLLAQDMASEVASFWSK